MKTTSEKTEKTICLAPFIQVMLSPTGEINPCCWNQDIHFGNIKQKDFHEIWNGETAKNLRREFISGEIKSCKKQIQHIGCHKYFEHFKDIVELTEIQSRYPQKIDLRLNGRCNLKCTMCDVWEQPNGIYDDTFFWRDGPEKIFPHLLEIDMLGGEPFVQRDTFKLIDIVSKLNPSCSWAFVTNAHYNFNRALEDKLEKLPIRWFQVSIDSISPKTYPLIRKGGNFKKVIKTLHDLISFRNRREKEGRGFDFLLSMCVQKDNWTEMLKFYNFCLLYNVKPIFQFAYTPDSCSLLTISKDEKNEILEFINERFSANGQKAVSPVYKAIMETIND